MSKFVEGARKNSQNIGISFSVVATWVVTTLFGVHVPAEVVAALAGLVTGIASKIND
jgi:hypothetical protein